MELRTCFIWGVTLILNSISWTAGQPGCQTIYVRWSRVRMNMTARVSGPYSRDVCQKACTNNEHPARSGYPLQCTGFNQRQGPNSLTHDCQIFQTQQFPQFDGRAEADDRFNFYWKYCVNSRKICNAPYHFSFHADRYMDKIEVAKWFFTAKLEDCLARCMDETTFTCRSASYNRTNGGCFLSAQNQLSKPSYIRVNNNPNFRIDYYESNCYNNSFTFRHECRGDGIKVSVESKYPYTGVLYGLYDYFTCRTEPLEQKRFSQFFPYPHITRNCSDSIRYKGGNVLLEVVLSTDGVEPLYFITPEDLTYQARCPRKPTKPKEKFPIKNGKQVTASVDFFRNTANVNQNKIDSTTLAPTSTLVLQEKYPKKKPGILPIIDSETENDKTNKGTKISVLVKLPSDKNAEKERTWARTRTTTKTSATSKPTTTATSSTTTTTATTTTTPTTTTTATTTTTPTTVPTTPTTTTKATTTTTATTSTSTPTTTTATTATSTSTPKEVQEIKDEGKWWYVTSDPVAVTRYRPKPGSTTTQRSAPSTTTQQHINTSVMSTTSTSTKITSRLTTKTVVFPTRKIFKPIVPGIIVLTGTIPKSPLIDEPSINKKQPASTIKVNVIRNDLFPDRRNATIKIKLLRNVTEPVTVVSSTTSTATAPLSTTLRTTKGTTTSTRSTTTSTRSTATSTRSTKTSRVTSKPTTLATTSTTVTSTTVTTPLTTTKGTTLSTTTTSTTATTTTTTPTTTTTTKTTSTSTTSTTAAPTTTSSSTTTMLSTTTLVSTTVPTTTVTILRTTEVKTPITTKISLRITPSNLGNNVRVTSQDIDKQVIGLPTLPPRQTNTNTNTQPRGLSWVKPGATIGSQKVTLTGSIGDTPVTSTEKVGPALRTAAPKPQPEPEPKPEPKPQPEVAPTTTTTTQATTTTLATTPTTTSTTTEAPKQPIFFDVFHRGQPVEAVVVGSRVTLSLTPYFAIPSGYMSLAGCQVEPVGSRFEWERDPLAIVKDGCQADNVGLVCPPERTDFGVRVHVEAFRYQSTAQVQYTCLVRVCPFAPCPQTFCPPVEGCPSSGSVPSVLSRYQTRTTQSRFKRQLFQGNQIRTPANQFGGLGSLGQGGQLTARQRLLQRNFRIPGSVPQVSPLLNVADRPPPAYQQHLLALAGDHLVKKRLIIVNSENELQFYIRTGSVPTSASFNQFNGFGK